MKKAKGKINKNQTVEAKKATIKNVCVDRKKDIVLIKNNLDEMSEDDIKKVLEKFSEGCKEFHKTYYSTNTPIVLISQRTFWDLLKIFISSSKETINSQKVKKMLKYKKG